MMLWRDLPALAIAYFCGSQLADLIDDLKADRPWRSAFDLIVFMFGTLALVAAADIAWVRP